MNNKSSFVIAAIAVVVVFAIVFLAIVSNLTPKIWMGQPMFDRASNAYLCEIEFGHDGYAVVYFRTPQMAQEFARLQGVEMVMRAMPVNFDRSEIIVEATR